MTEEQDEIQEDTTSMEEKFENMKNLSDKFFKQIEEFVKKIKK